MWALMVLSALSVEKIEELIEKRVRPLETELKRLRREREEELLRKKAEVEDLLEKPVEDPAEATPRSQGSISALVSYLTFARRRSSRTVVSSEAKS